MFPLIPAAQAGCTMDGTHQECTGAASGDDLTLGDSNVVSSIRIYDLTHSFFASAGCVIDLYGAGSLVINVNTGSFGLVAEQYGLTATVTTGPGSVTIDNIGSVTSGSTQAAIYGETRGGGAVNITTNGDLGGGYYGIWSRTSNASGPAGVVTVGAGAANLGVEGDDTWMLSASPALEIGGQIRAGILVLRPFARIGAATFFHDAAYETNASFIAAPGQTFTIESEFDKAYLDVVAGVDVLTLEGLNVKLTYDGRFSEHSDAHAGRIKASVPF